MNKKEAHSILAEHLTGIRSRSYAELVSWMSERRNDTLEVVAPSGTRYCIEVQFFWDDKPNGDVRVVGSIDDGGIRAFLPVTDSFILSPEGRFVGQ
ncbi:MAG: hypothetical protein NT154_08300 [Verrucomicrobia bacterium]|nr:hypothetical protein [Verrucomicrobiota bacterium]